MPNASPDIMTEAMSRFRAGDLGGAEQLCKQALATKPDDAEGLHLLGVLAHRAGRRRDAIQLVRQALSHAPDNPAHLNTLGFLLRLDQKYQDAEAALSRAIALRADYADAHNNLGIVYAESGDPARAEASYRDALKHRSEFPEAHSNLGNLLYRMGRLDDAVAAYEAATTLRPDYAEAYVNQGDAYFNKGDTDNALTAYKKAVEAAPEWANGWYKLANALYQVDQFDRAVLAYQRCVDLNPNQPRSLTNLGATLEKMGRIDEAAMILRHAVVLSPDDPVALKNLGHVVLKLGHVAEGLHLMRRSVEVAPDDPDAHYTYGNALVRMERLQEALNCYARVRELQPDAARAYFAPAAVLLMNGQYKEGWAAYESRYGMSTYKSNVKNVRERLWDGSPLNGRRLLVHVEQGFGDTLQFIRYLPLLRRREPEGKIILICEPELFPVLKQVEGYSEIYSLRSDNSIQYDTQIPLLSLPNRFATTLESIPNETPYTASPKDAKARLKRGKGTKLAVGIVWAGRPTHSDDRFRSCPVGWFSGLFDIPGVEFFSLQWGPRAGEITPYLDRKNVTSLSEELTDFGETAAFIEQLDLVIAIDTAVAHLAGALGKPVWTLLAFGGEWRWVFRREDTPWYPAMRLFRQRILGDWRPVFQRMKRALAQMASEAPSEAPDAVSIKDSKGNDSKGNDSKGRDSKGKGPKGKPGR
ncbi:MAG: tetratricopeptide repeat protein, partial [Rhodospirillaceae bacterium]|nr:tetratricopeptide repeat protein [Rhodospirillaceae bacterium]